MLTSQELMRLVDESGLELTAKPDRRIGQAIAQLVEKLNERTSDDSEE